jgi:ABC-2 type transport system permease protein
MTDHRTAPAAQTAEATNPPDTAKPLKTLTVGTEIRRQLTRRRTRLTFGLLVLLPFVLVAAFELGSDGDAQQQSFIDLATSGAANFTVFTLAVSSAFLLTVVVALFCGDTIASEASWGSLRYLLAIPVPRSRLLAVKLLVGLLSSFTALVVLAVTAFVVGLVAFGWHPLRTPLGDSIPPGAALARTAGMAAFLAVTLLIVAGLAFLLSVSTDAPLGAVGGAVLLVIVSDILDQIDALGVVRNVLPTHFGTGWQGWFADPVQLESMTKGTISALLYATAFVAFGWWRFLRKDVLS